MKIVWMIFDDCWYPMKRWDHSRVSFFRVSYTSLSLSLCDVTRENYTRRETNSRLTCCPAAIATTLLLPHHVGGDNYILMLKPAGRGVSTGKINKFNGPHFGRESHCGTCAASTYFLTAEFTNARTFVSSPSFMCYHTPLDVYVVFPT